MELVLSIWFDCSAIFLFVLILAFLFDKDKESWFY